MKMPRLLKVFWLLMGIIGICCLAALYNSTFAQSPRYGKRFFQNCTVQSGNTFQYRSTSNYIDLEKFFGTEGVSIGEEQWTSVEDDLGINFPTWLDKQVIGLRVPLDNHLEKKIQGFEFAHWFTVGLPYIQGKVRWASAGQLEQMSPFAQPAQLWGLASELISGDYLKFTGDATTAAIQHNLNQQTLVRGRLDIVVELNAKNVVFYKLNTSPWGSGSWSLDANLYPFWLWKSFDASNRIGVAEGFSIAEWLDEEIDGGPLFEDLSDDAVGLLSDYIDQQLFVPAGWPLYTGFGCRGEAVINYQDVLRVQLGIDYSSVSNGTRGVAPVQSWSFSAGIQVGIGGRTKRQRQQQLKKVEKLETEESPLLAAVTDTVFYIPDSSTTMANSRELEEERSESWVIRLGLYTTSVNLGELGLGSFPMYAKTTEFYGQPFFAVYVDETFSSEEIATSYALALELKEYLIIKQ